MRTFIALLRSLLFDLVFFGATMPLVLVAFVALAIGRDPFIRVAAAWSRLHRFCAHWIAGQRVVIEGVLPREPVFYVFKHESMFETIDLPRLLGMPVVPAKRELLSIPLWGRLARSYGVLALDRAGGATALRRLRKEAHAAIAAGRPLCFFPEGTRVLPGETPPLKSGFAGLYAILGVPVVPIAHDAGSTNSRSGLFRRPGIIRYRVGEMIPPGLDRKEAERRVHDAINVFNRER